MSENVILDLIISLRNNAKVTFFYAIKSREQKINICSLHHILPDAVFSD